MAVRHNRIHLIGLGCEFTLFTSPCQVWECPLILSVELSGVLRYLFIPHINKTFLRNRCGNSAWVGIRWLEVGSTILTWFTSINILRLIFILQQRKCDFQCCKFQTRTYLISYLLVCWSPYCKHQSWTFIHFVITWQQGWEAVASANNVDVGLIYLDYLWQRNASSVINLLEMILFLSGTGCVSFLHHVNVFPFHRFKHFYAAFSR